MSKLQIAISARKETQGNEKLYRAGVFGEHTCGPTMWDGLGEAARMVSTCYREDDFNKLVDKLDEPIRNAFQRAKAEIDQHKVADRFRIWSGWYADDGWGGGYEPLRQCKVAIEGYPGATLKVSKYRSCAHTMAYG